jgi:hypothetical protein
MEGVVTDVVLSALDGFFVVVSCVFADFC